MVGLRTDLLVLITVVFRSPVLHIQFVPVFIIISNYKFDLVDSRDGSPIQNFETGTAHYINGNVDDTYNLKIICYDDFLHQFIFDDGNGHTHVSRLKDGVKVSDFIVYETSNSKTYFIVHELSDESSGNKIRTAKKQLSDTLNQLYKSETIAAFISDFTNKLCILSAKDNREIVSPDGMADGFSEIYKILPEPLQFNFGQIKTHGFTAFETSYVRLSK